MAHRVGLDRSGTSTEGVLVGRERERKDMEAAVTAALDGHGRLLLLSGEPGIGKTALAHAIETRSLAGSRSSGDGAGVTAVPLHIGRGFR